MTFQRHLLRVLVAAAIGIPAAPASGQGRTEERPVVVKVSDGFDWLDAGIGAAAALALVLLVIGLTLSVRQVNEGRRQT